MPNPNIKKYTYYVRELNDYNTREPTESTTAVPTQPVLSPSPQNLQYIIDKSVYSSIEASIITSIITTYFVIFFSYFCIVIRAKLRRRYLDNIHQSSDSDSDSDLTCTEESSSQKQDPFWFEDVYNERIILEGSNKDIV